MTIRTPPGLYVDYFAPRGSMSMTSLELESQVTQKSRTCSYATRRPSPSATSGRIKTTSSSEGGWRVSHEQYLTKIKPINVDKARMADTAAAVSEAERSQLRTLVGALQWASTQTSPHLQVHASQIAGCISSATVQTLLDANKALRFAQANSDVGRVLAPRPALRPHHRHVYRHSFCQQARRQQPGRFHHSACEPCGPQRLFHVIDWGF